MKLLTREYAFLLLLAGIVSSPIKAYNEESRQDCYQNNYECACNPLYCGALDIQFHGGVAPILWKSRGSLSTLNCANALPVTTVADIPSFRTFFRTPWIVGGQIGYAWSDNARLYLEFDYIQARANSAISIPLSNLLVPATLSPQVGKYSLYSFYIGTRYYWDRWCDRVSIFLGGKLGVTSHRSVSIGANLVTPPPGCPSAPSNKLFTRNSNLSAGGNIGFDICMCGNWSFVVTAELVANCGPKSVGNILSDTDSFALGFATNLLVGGIETELIFPVTFGIRYNF